MAASVSALAAGSWVCSARVRAACPSAAPPSGAASTAQRLCARASASSGLPYNSPSAPLCSRSGPAASLRPGCWGCSRSGKAAQKRRRPDKPAAWRRRPAGRYSGHVPRPPVRGPAGGNSAGRGTAGPAPGAAAALCPPGASPRCAARRPASAAARRAAPAAGCAGFSADSSPGAAAVPARCQNPAHATACRCKTAAAAFRCRGSSGPPGPVPSRRGGQSRCAPSHSGPAPAAPPRFGPARRNPPGPCPAARRGSGCPAAGPAACCAGRRRARRRTDGRHSRA